MWVELKGALTSSRDHQHSIREQDWKEGPGENAQEFQATMDGDASNMTLGAAGREGGLSG